MTKSLSATEVRVHFGEVLDEVDRSRSRVIIERGGKPIAVMAPIADLAVLEKADRDIDAILERARKHRAAIAERLKREGKQLPDVVEVIRHMREERSEQLLENLL